MSVKNYCAFAVLCDIQSSRVEIKGGGLVVVVVVGEVNGSRGDFCVEGEPLMFRVKSCRCVSLNTSVCV